MSVFICHAKEDKAEVRRLNTSLQSAGFETWFDEERLLPGEDWQAAIVNAIRSAAAVLICLSSTSVSKTGYVQKELRFALDAALYMPPGATFLIPCLLSDVNLPESLSHIQAVDIRLPGAFERLVVALKRRYLALDERGMALPEQEEATSALGTSPRSTVVQRPKQQGDGSNVDVTAIRFQLNLSQAEFAERFGLSVATIQRWEQGRSTPTAPAKRFLQLIAAQPEAVQAEIRRLKDGGADIWTS